MTEQENNAIAEAFNVLRAAMYQDHGYAWSWHCNLAMAVYDAGCDPVIANKGAARFMQTVFGLDMTAFVEYQDIMERHHASR